MRNIIFMVLFCLTDGLFPNVRVYFEQKKGCIRIRIPIMNIEKSENFTNKQNKQNK